MVTSKKKFIILLLSVLILLVFISANIKIPDEWLSQMAQKDRKGKENFLSYLLHHRTTRSCYHVTTEEDIRNAPPPCSEGAKNTVEEYAKALYGDCTLRVLKVGDQQVEGKQIKDFYFGIPVTREFCPSGFRPKCSGVVGCSMRGFWKGFTK